MIRLTLKPGREESVLRRHPWLFSGAVATEEGDGSDGHAEVVDARGRPLARGAYSPDSQIRARLWTFDGRQPDASLFRERFDAARQLRRTSLRGDTTGFRAVHSEGDLCPGVVVDLYGDTALIELLTEGTERWEGPLREAVESAFRPARIMVRRTGRARDRGATRGLRDVSSETPVEAVFREDGLRFVADLTGGQKTGFYLDQRENRVRLRGLAGGRALLNLFSYSGGFSVAALAGGATRAVDVDSSQPALDLARRHRRENGFAADEADLVRADVFEEVRRRSGSGESWDVVVCDPPALAKRRGDVERAARAYKDLNRHAMSLVAVGGWLLTCSCSGLIDAALFQKIVFSASLEAGRTFSIAARQGAGADHPVSLDCPEGEYLKSLWLYREA